MSQRGIYTKDRSQTIHASFTLIEVVVAMTVFSIMMLVMIRIFLSAQTAWSKASARTEMFENARLAMDLMARDLQSAYYENGKVPFWLKEFNDAASSGGSGEFRNELLCFVSTTPVPQSSNNSSRQFEVGYQLYYCENHANANAGWLMRSVTGDTSGAKWNFYRDNDWTANPVVSKDNAATAFTTTEASRDAFQKLIPFVTELDFTALRQRVNAGNPELEEIIATNNTTPTEFPYAVMIRLSVLDRISWEKWKGMGALPHQPMQGGESAAAKQFREDNQRTFTKTVLVGNRGQY